jgi:hypothetical protein
MKCFKQLSIVLVTAALMAAAATSYSAETPASPEKIPASQPFSFPGMAVKTSIVTVMAVPAGKPAGCPQCNYLN